jgi:hypothetical protein
MWLNAMDIIAAAYRPNYHVDKSDQSVQLHIHKVKNQKLVGVPGIIELTFNRLTNRYYEENGCSPLEGWQIPIDTTQAPVPSYYEVEKAPF